MDQVSQQQYFTKYLSPANPIITKQVQTQTQTKVTLEKFQNPLTVQKKIDHNHDRLREDYSSSQQQYQRLSLLNVYSSKSLIYKKYENQEYRERNKKQYYASIFANLIQMPQIKPYSVESHDGIRFSSGGESMNLFAVYQTGPKQFDLILQNDINTSGYTQWFYFSVHNKHKNQTIKLNIVNLYKSKSLYNEGMKPLAYSVKANKGWQRACANIFYTDNQIHVEHSHKFYHTLSFQYTFLQDNGQTHFAHCYPYTYSNLKQKLSLLQKNPNVKISSIGMTSMKNAIPIVQFSQDNSNLNKKAVVILARQHSGETVGSLIMDQILSSLGKVSSIQNEFLLWRFNIYCIPMVNIDGVILGNYRGNFYGYDLNRCWDRDNVTKLPQVFHIKKQIKKIHKKYPIELILDLHGHSRKMNSFFYGNPFGKNTGLFAYAASKISPNIRIQNSTFHKQKAVSQKSTTARIILGNIIKETGSFYTHQTSFYGFTTNNKKYHFNNESFQQLGRSLLNSIYKTFVQIQKEEKTLKESLFLKEVRKQLQQQKNNCNFNDSSSGSDSEAEKLTLKQIAIKNIQQFATTKSNKNAINEVETNKQAEQQTPNKRSIQIQVGQGEIERESFQSSGYSYQIKKRQLQLQNFKKQRSLKSRKLSKIGNHSQKYSLLVGIQKSQQFAQKIPQYQSSSPFQRKNYLMDKLRIFGQTFIQPNPKETSKHTQAGNSLNSYLNKNFNTLKAEDSPLKITQYRRKKCRNKSLIIKIENKDKLTMADIVKVNRLEYKRVANQPREWLQKKRQQKQMMKISILPIIN